MKQFIAFLIAAILFLCTGNGFAQFIPVNEAVSTATVTSPPVNWSGNTIFSQSAGSWNLDNQGSEAVSNSGFTGHRVILNLFQDLFIDGLGFRNEIGMTLPGGFDTALSNVLINSSIPLISGWNIVSFNQTVTNMDLKAIFQSLINDGSLIKVQDETGHSLEDLGIFGGWINNIGQMALSEGYKVKVSRDCFIPVEGSPVILPYKIPLKAGWNIAGYPGQLEENALSVVQPLIDRGTLVKVQDENGNAIENLGSFGGWVNGIGVFKPGKGYKIRTNASDTLTFTKKSGSYSVTIYGYDECGYTTLLRQSCTNAGIRFQYCNIYSNSDCWTDMWNIVYQFNLNTGNSVILPVVKVEVDSDIYGLKRPSVEDIKRLINF